MVPSQPDLPTHIDNTFFPDLDFSNWITKENVSAVGTESQYLGQLSNGPLQLPPAEGVMQHNQLSQGWGFYSSTLDPTSVAQYSLHPELAMLSTAESVESDLLAMPYEMQIPSSEVLSTVQHDPTHVQPMSILMGIPDCTEKASSDVAVQQSQPLSYLSSSATPYEAEILASSEAQKCIWEGNGVQTTDVAHGREHNNADQAPSDIDGFIFARRDTQKSSISTPIAFDV